MKFHKRLSRFIFDFVNGIRSGIPVCCTIYFSVELAIHPDTPVSQAAMKRRGSTENVGYVRCDHCHNTNHVAKVKKNGVIWDWLVK